MVASSVAAFLWAADRRRLNRFSRRESIEFPTWYNLYYGPESGLSARKVKTIVEAISSSIGVQAVHLRPTDRLEAELSIPEAGQLDDTIEIIQQHLCEQFNQSIIVQKNWKTVDDIVRGVVPVIE